MTSPSKEEIAKRCLKTLGIDLNELSADDEKNLSAPIKRVVNIKSRKIQSMYRTEQLAIPNYRRLQQWPDPRLEGPPVITQAVICGRIPSRLEYLSRPKIDYSEDADFYLPPIPKKLPLCKDKNVSNSDTSISSRLFYLSQPKLDIPEEVIKKKSFKSKKHWEAYRKKLKKFAAPRRELLSPLEPVRQKKTPLEKILPRLTELSKPVSRPPNNNERMDEEMSKVNAATLSYVATERIRKLSMHKKINEETLLNLNYNPRTRLLKSKKYIATDRIMELSRPIFRKATQEEEIKMDAFKVNPRALKARLTPRLRRLAQPIIR